MPIVAIATIAIIATIATIVPIATIATIVAISTLNSQLSTFKMTVYEIAEEFIQLTNCSVFLTGKAGTGKTTMLRQIREAAFKQTAVVAPTGVAAINAGGTTIHSFFQLPFSPFIPTIEAKKSFIAKQQVNSVRRKIYRELELLIIDEVSMVRADVLDAIDTVLRHYRFRPNEPFGGVQVVFIGDMYQLPPVCVGEEWELLRRYYESPYFFHSQVIYQDPPIYIELDKIFRQSNQQFINLLNEVRNNQLTPDTFRLLSHCYQPNFRNVDEYITLTTHNASADAINNDELAKIDAPYYKFMAHIDRDFPERIFPTEVELVLKLGAKVMFIANDMAQPRRYYNGKIGEITEINDNEIWVTCDGESEAIKVSLEVWENKSYTIDPETNQLEEKTLGTFTQYPLRLAWAITIHKSQGLTFDRVVIDAAAAFASGQVYVALSRCRSLDGIVLTSQINPNSLAVDPQIVRYSEQRLPIVELERQVELFKSRYSLQLLVKLFSLEDLMSHTVSFVNYIKTVLDDFNEDTAPYLDELLANVNSLYAVARRFIAQLLSFNPKSDIVRIAERVKAAAGYFVPQLDDLLILIESSPAITESKVEAQDYIDRLQAIFEITSQLRHVIDGIADDISVVNYFDAKQSYKVPPFKVKAYVVEREVKMLKTDHPKLYKMLATWRNDYCKENNIPAFQMFGNATLVEVSNKLPIEIEQLIKIKGFGKIKIQRFGKECVDIVRIYCRENGIEASSQSDIAFEPESEHGDEKPKKRKRREKEKVEKIPSEEITLSLINQGKTLQEIADERGLVLGTIYTHLAKLIHAKKIDIAQYVDADLLDRVMSILNTTPEISNSELFEFLEGSATYDDLRLIRAYQLSINNQ